MEIQSSARVTKPSRRPIIVAGILFIQLLLMGAAFVGGRLFASQNQRANQGTAAQLPSQLPKDSPAASGAVQSIQGSQITLTRGGFGGPGGPPGSEDSGQSSTSTQTQVTVSAETKYYKSTSGDPGMPGAQTQSVQAQEGAFADVKIGNMITVWGLNNGGRVTAEVVYVQSFGR